MLTNLKNITEKENDLVSQGGEKTTYLQLEKIASYIEEDSKQSNIILIVLAIDNYYARSIDYIIKKRDNIIIEKYFKASDFDPPFVYNDVYYVGRINSRSCLDDEVKSEYKIISEKEMGSLVVYRIGKK